jgi:short-subunit dehydrogenase
MMRIPLRPLAEQIMVITGASSGIGLTTARRAAQRGARLVLAARNEAALNTIAAELRAQGKAVAIVVADVGDLQQVRRISEVARKAFGGFDTWINNAGVSVFGRIEEVPLEDHRRLFETNFWGVVHGSLVAVEHLRRRGGAIINLGSEVSDVAIPLQGMYSASKHAVKGFTDALRLELEEAQASVSVTLVKPAAIDTMFVPHARNYMDVEPKLPSPIYAPEVVADAILYAAQHVKRDVYAGGASKLFSLGNRLVPRWIDKYLERFMFRQQRSPHPVRLPRPSALYAAGVGLRERQGHEGHVCESSLYTRMTTPFAH